MNFVEICIVCAKRAIIKAAKRIINSDKMCRSYSDLNFGVTLFGTQCITDDLGRPTHAGRRLTGHQTRLTTFVSVFSKSSTAAVRGEARPHIRVSPHLHREDNYRLLHGVWPAADTQKLACVHLYVYIILS